jgi:hypothetical protein
MTQNDKNRSFVGLEMTKTIVIKSDHQEKEEIKWNLQKTKLN